MAGVAYHTLVVALFPNGNRVLFFVLEGSCAAELLRGRELPSKCGKYWGKASSRRLSSPEQATGNKTEQVAHTESPTVINGSNASFHGEQLLRMHALFRENGAEAPVEDAQFVVQNGVEGGEQEGNSFRLETRAALRANTSNICLVLLSLSLVRMITRLSAPPNTSNLRSRRTTVWLGDTSLAKFLCSLR